MQSTYKYGIAAPYGAMPMHIPRGAVLLSAQVQKGTPVIWALVDQTQPLERRWIGVYVTGDSITDKIKRHVGTLQLQGGALVLHVFELEAP